jgi:hypothetical protein
MAECSSATVSTFTLALQSLPRAHIHTDTTEPTFRAYIHTGTTEPTFRAHIHTDTNIPLELWIREVQCSDLGLLKCCSDIFRGFPQSVWAGAVTLSLRHIRLFSCPSPVILCFDATDPEWAINGRRDWKVFCGIQNGCEQPIGGIPPARLLTVGLTSSVSKTLLRQHWNQVWRWLSVTWHICAVTLPVGPLLHSYLHCLPTLLSGWLVWGLLTSTLCFMIPRHMLSPTAQVHSSCKTVQVCKLFSL